MARPVVPLSQTNVTSSAMAMSSSLSACRVEGPLDNTTPDESSANLITTANDLKAELMPLNDATIPTIKKGGGATGDRGVGKGGGIGSGTGSRGGSTPPGGRPANLPVSPGRGSGYGGLKGPPKGPSGRIGPPASSGGRESSGSLGSSGRGRNNGNFGGGPNWKPLPVPVPFVPGSGGVVGGGGGGHRSNIYNDGYRKGYQDGCYSTTWSPASYDAEYYEGYKMGRDSGTRQCRPMNGNNQEGGGWGSWAYTSAAAGSAVQNLSLLAGSVAVTLLLL